MYGYGLFSFGTTSGDSLVLFFGATAIGLSPALVGLLDAANSLTFAIGAVALVFILPHLAKINVLLVLSLWGFGLVLILHSAVGSPTAILALALPYGLLQAPASVLAPVVATNIGGIPEIVDDGINGFLLPPNEPQLLADKIIYLLDNKDKAAEMGARGRRKVVEEFADFKQIEHIEKVYKDILGLV